MAAKLGKPAGQMLARIKGEGPPPNTPPDSATVQLPVFADPQDRGSELEWMIFDLNRDYLSSKVLPRLVTEYLNPTGDAVYDVSVSTPAPNGASSSRPAAINPALLPGPMCPPAFSPSKWAPRRDAAVGASGMTRVLPDGRSRCAIVTDRSISRWRALANETCSPHCFW
jgi:hypothetical protein